MFWIVVLVLLALLLVWAAVIAMVLVQDHGAAIGVMIVGVVCAVLSGGCALWAIHLFFLRIRL